MFMLIQRLLKVSSFGLCAALLLASGLVEAKSTNTQPMVTTQDMEEEVVETTTTPQRTRLLPGAQRRMERREARRISYPGGEVMVSEGGVSYPGGGVTWTGGITVTANGGVSISGPNISETQDNVIVTMQLSGFTANDITAKVEGNNLRILAQSNRQGSQNSVNNSFPLPCAVDAKRMTKKMSNGVLTITLPKAK